MKQSRKQGPSTKRIGHRPMDDGRKPDHRLGAGLPTEFQPAQLKYHCHLIMDSILKKFNGDFEQVLKLNSDAGLAQLTVEVLRVESTRKLISLTHYIKHESGDMKKDPDMTFVVAKGWSVVHEWQNDFLSKYDRATELDSDLNVVSINKSKAWSLVAFAESWLHQIRDFYSLSENA